MGDHYYSSKPSVKSEERKWNDTLRSHDFTFISDRGVFSKNEVDFGSRLLIESFTFPTIQGDVLDVGCGYGPIGLTLAKEEPGRMVHMVDVNERALSLAERNAERNQIKNVRIYKSNCLDQVTESQFAVIVTNPPIRAGKKVVHQIFEQAHSILKEEGELWVVIQKKQGAPSAIEMLSGLYEVEVISKKKGYYIIKAIKN